MEDENDKITKKYDRMFKDMKQKTEIGIARLEKSVLANKANITENKKGVS